LEHKSVLSYKIKINKNKGKTKMTEKEKEKEIIIDALESGIALSRIYLGRLEYLHENIDDDDIEKETDYFIKIIEAKRRIKTLETLKEQYK
jgi:hypothetical protein